MMSQILLINGVLNIFVCGLFFFYINKYRYLMSRFRMIIFSTFSLYYLFIGFLRIRVARELEEWNILELTYNDITVFNLTSTITMIILSIFLYFTVTFKGKIYVDKNN